MSLFGSQKIRFSSDADFGQDTKCLPQLEDEMG